MKLRFLSIYIIAIAILSGCENNDDSPTSSGIYTPGDSTWSDGSGGYHVRLKATSYDRYRYYDLSTRSVIDLADADALTDNSWQLGFRRYFGKINGGTSGAGDMKAVDLAALNHPDSIDYNDIVTLPFIADSLWESDSLSLAIADEDWWFYTGAPAHQILPTRKAFILKTAAGKFAKFTIDSISGSSRDAVGIVGLKYVYQSDGSTNLNGETRLAELDASAHPVYFLFDEGQTVQIGNPLTSTEWDLQISGYQIRLNSASSGPGSAAALPSDTTFDAIVDAPVGPPINRMYRYLSSEPNHQIPGSLMDNSTN